MVKSLPSNVEGVHSIPNQGTNNSHATGYSQNSLKIFKKRERLHRLEASRQYEVLKRDGNFIESFSLMNSEQKEHWKDSTLERNSNCSGTNVHRYSS